MEILSLTPEQVLEQIELGAVVLPQFAPEGIAIQVGRRTGVCNCDRFRPEQVAVFTVLYWQRRVAFVWPGDFTNPPAFLNGKTRTSLIPIEKTERARLATALQQKAAEEVVPLALRADSSQRDEPHHDKVSPLTEKSETRKAETLT